MSGVKWRRRIWNMVTWGCPTQFWTFELFQARCFALVSISVKTGCLNTEIEPTENLSINNFKWVRHTVSNIFSVSFPQSVQKILKPKWKAFLCCETKHTFTEQAQKRRWIDCEGAYNQSSVNVFISQGNKYCMFQVAHLWKCKRATTTNV